MRNFMLRATMATRENSLSLQSLVLSKTCAPRSQRPRPAEMHKKTPPLFNNPHSGRLAANSVNCPHSEIRWLQARNGRTRQLRELDHAYSRSPYLLRRQHTAHLFPHRPRKTAPLHHRYQLEAHIQPVTKPNLCQNAY